MGRSGHEPTTHVERRARRGFSFQALDYHTLIMFQEQNSREGGDRMRCGGKTFPHTHTWA